MKEGGKLEERRNYIFPHFLGGKEASRRERCIYYPKMNHGPLTLTFLPLLHWTSGASTDNDICILSSPPKFTAVPDIHNDQLYFHFKVCTVGPQSQCQLSPEIQVFVI